MSYSPNNVYVYLQAFSGAVSGLLGQNNSLSTTRGSNTDTIEIAGAWAQEVDTIWGSGTNPDLFEYQTIFDFSNDLFQVFDPPADTGITGNGSSTNPATYENSVNLLIRVLEDGEAYLAAQGIIPPFIPVSDQGFVYVSASAAVAASASKIVVLASAGTVTLTLPALATLPNNWELWVMAQGCTSPIVIQPPTGTIWDPSMGIFNGTATLPNGSGGSIARWQFDKANSRFVETV